MFMRRLSVSPVPNLGKMTQSPQSDLTPWILTLSVRAIKTGIMEPRILLKVEQNMKVLTIQTRYMKSNSFIEEANIFKERKSICEKKILTSAF